MGHCCGGLDIEKGVGERNAASCNSWAGWEEGIWCRWLEKIRSGVSGGKDWDSDGGEGVVKVFALKRGLIPTSVHRYILNRIYKVRGRGRCRGILLFLWSRAVRFHLMVVVGGWDPPPAAGEV